MHAGGGTCITCMHVHVTSSSSRRQNFPSIYREKCSQCEQKKGGGGKLSRREELDIKWVRVTHIICRQKKSTAKATAYHVDAGGWYLIYIELPKP